MSGCRTRALGRAEEGTQRDEARGLWPGRSGLAPGAHVLSPFLHCFLLPRGVPSISRSRSTSNFFNRVFSRSSSFSRAASDASMPPYLLRQREKVASRIACLRHSTSIVVCHVSASCRTVIMWASVNRPAFIACSLSLWTYSSKAMYRKADVRPPVPPALRSTAGHPRFVEAPSCAPGMI